MRLQARLVAPSGEAAPLDVTEAVVRLGRDPGCEVAVDPVAYPKVSGLHARIEEAPGGFVLVPLSKSNRTLLNNSPIEGPVPVRDGDRVRLGATGPTLEISALSRTPAAEPPARFGETVQATDAHLSLLRGTARADRFAVGAGGVIGRESGKVQFHLDHPHVSRLHASLAVRDGRVVLADLGSANGTFVNGRRVGRPVALAPGDRIDIGPFALRFDGDELVGTSRADNVELVARGVGRVVQDRASGEPLILLDGVSLVVRPREFVALLGPSGSGKSTLLRMLSGRAAPDAGTVSVNGRDLYANFSALKQDIAVVPQRDILHETLPVGRALGYTAELRLPSDTAPEDIEAAVGDILGVVGLADRGDTLIRHLSGGQVKRASLANELLCRPSLLFLDEVTSGLDEETDRGMMDLFRMVADGGKTVVCVTHNMANVEATCHLVVILSAGGKLAFVGTPDEAKVYFGVARLGDVYRRLADETPEAWQKAFRASPYHTRYVQDRLPADSDLEPDPEVGDDEQEPVPASPFRQASVLTRRYAAVWQGDPTALLAMFGQSLLVAVLLAAVFGRLPGVDDPAERGRLTVNLLFLLGVSCFWLGCNNAAKEVVRERAIFARERDVNLRADSYYASKLAVLLAIGLIQVALLFVVVRLVCGPPGNPVAQWAVLSALVLAGTALGLLISVVSRTEEVATALVPVAVIPQIILAGVIAPLSGIAEVLAKALISVYWGQDGLAALLPEADRVILSHQPASTGTSLGVLAGHAAFCAGLTLLLLRTRRETTG
ncbi:MAG: FHA domain-containing protein [Gemmataceae bacterium]|nr:FHA domain-containing protein [Gemmataceae bacterium]